MEAFLEREAVTEEPAPNRPVLFTETPSSFSEVTDQDGGSCRRSRPTGENWGLQLHPELQSHHPLPDRTEGPGHNGLSNTRTLSEAKGPLPRKTGC